MRKNEIAETVNNMVSNVHLELKKDFERRHIDHDLDKDSTVRPNRLAVSNGHTYQFFFEKNKSLRRMPTVGYLDKRLQYLYDKINYIPMSPNHKDDHMATYIIKKSRKRKIRNIEAYIDNMEWIELNYSKEELEKIFKFWMEKSIEVSRRDKFNFSMFYHTVYLLIGDPGIGKTALLNYIFSVNANKMIRKNIFWIRIDLNNIDNLAIDIEIRKRLKFLKIFTAKYAYNTKRKMGENFMDEMQQYLISKLSEWEGGEKHFYEKCKVEVDDFMDLIKDLRMEQRNGSKLSVHTFIDQYDHLDKRKVSRLSGYIMEYLQTKFSYSFIIIFDGLDTVTLDSIQYKHYKRWVKKILTIVNNRQYSAYRAVYIITMRPYSYIDLYINQKSIIRDNRSIVKCLVRPYPLQEVVKKRFEYALTKIKKDKIGLPSSSEDFWNISNNLLDMINCSLHGLSVKEFQKDFIEKKYWENPEMDLFSTITNGSLRATMRFLRTLIVVIGNELTREPYQKLASKRGYDGALKHISGKEWIITKVLIFGDRGSILYKSRIDYSNTGEVQIHSRHNALIHNILNYNNCDLNHKQSMYPRNLLKLHALKIAKSLKPLSIISLINELTKLYPEIEDELIRNDIRELIYNGLIYPQIENKEDQITLDELGAEYSIRITGSGKKMIENIINQFIYYEIIQDDSPISIRYVDDIEPLHRFDERKNLGEYLISKTRSVINFLLYLQKAEKNIADKYDEKKASNNYIKDIGFIYSDQRVDKIINNLKEIISGYMNDLSTSKRDEYLEEWNQAFGV